MGTTVFFEQPLNDAANRETPIDHFEFGRTTFFKGENRMYMKVDDKQIIFEPEKEKEFFESVFSLGFYLGYYR